MSAPVAGERASASSVSAATRAAAYALVAVPLLRLPDDTFLDQLRSAAYADALQEVGAAVPTPAMGEALEAIRSYVAALPPADDAEASRDALDELVRDRTYLLRALAPDVGAPPPYETHWHGPEQGESVMLSLAEAYRRAGVAVGRDAHQRGDYLGIELAFMMGLAQQEADAPVAGRAALRAEQADFFRRHLGSWADDYACAALPLATTAFFRGLLQALRALVAQERLLLSDQAA